MSDDDMFLSSPSQSTNSFGYASSNSLAQSFTPSAPTDYSESQNLIENVVVLSQLLNTPDTDAENHFNSAKIVQVKVEFLDENGHNVSQTRYSDNEEIVSILCALVRSNDPNYMKSTVKKMCSSKMFESELQNNILHKLSNNFSKLLTNEHCPLKNDEIFNSMKEFCEIDLDKVLLECFTCSPDLLNALSILCFGKDSFNEVIQLPGSKYMKQRLLAVLSISAISRNQRVNLYQRIVGEYLKLKNTSKQGLQLIHRLGLSLVSVSIRADQDKIAKHFMKEVEERRQDIELWARRRKMLETLIEDEMQSEKGSNSAPLNVKFTPDTFIPQIHNLGSWRSYKSNVPKVVEKIQPDEHVIEIVENTETKMKALDCHLENRPALVDITFDNIDIGRVGKEFIAGESKDQSLHWTSSIVVQDIVHGIEIEDSKVNRSVFVELEEKLHVTMEEQEHLCTDYSLFVMNVIFENWPKLLPDIKKEHIPHQYSKEFEQNIPMWTGPLIFESENDLNGMQKVLTHLIDVVCPVIVNMHGKKVPIYPTTFSGDNKSEQSARSAQLAMADNGDMRDQLAFIQGRHEMLHFEFMIVEVIMDILADKQNLEEAASLSRLMQWLNPKLVNKHAKDDFYKFRDTLTDIYIALLGENLREFLKVENLENDATPEPIKNEMNPGVKQSLLFQFIRGFVIKTHDDFKDCKPTYQDVKPLPKFYPHQEFVRKRDRGCNVAEDMVENLNVDDDADMKDQSEARKGKTKPDHKYEYGGAMLSLLGQFELLIDCVKEANGLNIFLIQKKLHKIVFSTGHKNYACSMSSFKHIVLSHPVPQYSHRYMWNQFCGRAGKGNKMARDQREEHLNRFLKDGFKTLGVNLNPTNATRINNSADLGQTLVKKVTDFHRLDIPGKNHTKKDRKPIIKKISEVFKKEEIVKYKPGRKFNGPNPARSVSTGYDEARYRVWHQSKENELVKFSLFRDTFMDD